MRFGLMSCFKRGRVPISQMIARNQPNRSLGILTEPQIPHEGLEDRPLIMLLGWAFSHDRQLVKFSDVFTDLGYRTMRTTLPFEHFITQNHPATRDFAAGLLQDVRESNRSRTKDIVIYGFSNVGCMLYQHLLEEVESDESFRVKGVILDSGPSTFNMKPSFLLGNLMSPETISKPSRWSLSLFNLYLRVTANSESPWGAFRNMLRQRPSLKANWQSNFPTPAEHLLQDNRMMPILFLYSDADAIIPANFLEVVIQRQRTKGRAVFAQNFGKSSGHVAHLKKCPDIYKSTVKDFLDYISKEKLNE